MFDARVLQVTEDILLKWRHLVEEGRTGHTFSQPDLIIAATAIHHGLTIVTPGRWGVGKTGARNRFLKDAHATKSIALKSL